MRKAWVVMLVCVTNVVLADPLLRGRVLENREFFYQVREFRNYTGEANNLKNRDWGKAGERALRFPVTSYGDGKGLALQTARDSRLNPRVISNNVLFDPDPRVSELVDSPKGISDFFWLWGQFLDHDIVLTNAFKKKNRHGKEVKDSFPILVPGGDPDFDPQGRGFEFLPFSRSNFKNFDGVRFQINDNSAYIDASNVYGSSERRANALRQKLRDGRLSPYLRVSAGPNELYPLLPYNTNGLDNAPDDNPRFPKRHFFLAGDVRANEQVSLTALHTIFVREHNYIVSEIETALASRGLPALSPQKLYHLARMIVGAEMQVITYRDFLPLLLGAGAMPRYPGYNPNINPGIINTFSTATFRFGHSMVPPKLLLADRTMRPVAQLGVRDVFFEKVPNLLRNNGMLANVLRGMARQSAQDIDLIINDDLRTFLFGIPEIPAFIAKRIKIPKGLDLAALNIQRGRDHGIPLYNEARRAYKLQPVRTFADITADPAMQKRLASVYRNVEEIDTWVGGLAEQHMRGAMVGQLCWTSILDQFRRLRDGDRFWYQVHLPAFLRDWVERQTLSGIIQRNSVIGPEMPRNVFVVGS